jgi:hypothetical protein
MTQWISAIDEKVKIVDPLDVTKMPESLIVSPIGPYHTLALNKYNAIRDHVSMRQIFSRKNADPVICSG